MERVKSAAGESLPAEIIADDEPRYLRRQKPVEVRKKGFGRSLRESWRVWLRRGALAAVGGAALFAVARFFLFSPAVILAAPEQVEVTGNRYVSREAVVNLFAPDQGRSILRVPLEARRQALERIAWVGEARVMRILPNRLRVDLVERQPVAFLRSGGELALIDASGVILERPARGNFHFPVITGLSEAMPRPECERRMKLFMEFMEETEKVRAGANEHLSEADLSDAADLRATLVGLPAMPAGLPATPAGLPDVAAASAGPQTVLVHFGAADFGGKFRLLLDNYSQWSTAAGRVESIDLRFRGQVVVNPDSRHP